MTAMEKRQDRFYLYLAWPAYLAQFFAHEMYRLKHYDDDTEPPYMYDCHREPRDLEPVQTRKRSAENFVLEMCLKKQPDPVPERPPKDATICIEIPEFVGKPSYRFNYLTAVDKALLEQTVRNRCRMELLKWMNKLSTNAELIRTGSNHTQETVLQAFMAANGIEDTETNYLTIRDLWRRLYKYEHQKRRKK